MDNFEEKARLCALNRIFGFDPKTGLALLSHFGSADEVFRHSEEVFGPHARYKGLINPQAVRAEMKELAALSEKGISFHGITEDTYPALLKECEDAPVGLYVRSSTAAEELWKGDPISVVGTRDITPYGKEWCRKIVNGIAASGRNPLIISGLAIGVDIEAHRSAVEAGLPTIAVMATGPDMVYPHRHKAFADMLSRTPGCALITDYPPGTAPLAIHFLRRNRIIAGLSRATILVESKARGGGLMTCNLAFSYNRDVYALPGRVDDTRSQGCNDLIRKKVAEPVTSVKELMESLGMKFYGKNTGMTDRENLFQHYRHRFPDYTIELMSGIMSAIRKRRGITVEELAESKGEPYERIAELTGILEIDGFISTDLLQRCTINHKFM